MNPASFNTFIALLEEVSEAIYADDTIRSIIKNTASESVENLEKVLTNGVH